VDQVPQIGEILLEQAGMGHTEHRPDRRDLGGIDLLGLADHLAHDRLGGIAGLQARDDKVEGHGGPQRQHEELDAAGEIAHNHSSLN
jgi:hypothetical protein